MTQTLRFVYDGTTPVGFYMASDVELAALGLTPGNPPTPTLEEAKAAKLEALAAYRFDVENGGTTLAGSFVATDEKTRSVLTAARIKAREDDNFTVNYKFGPGLFATLTAAQIIATADGVAAFIQACFDREEVLSDLILAAANQAALDAIDITTGWP